VTATLVLASRSPRRSDLLRSVGLAFVVEPADVDESLRPDEHPHAYVERLARAKAEEVAGPARVCLGGDTVVVHDGVILGKPAHPSEARAMLRRLRGNDHHVVSGVAVARLADGSMRIDSMVVSALVRFGAMTDGEVDAYVDGGEPLDCAGAYALQGRGGVYVDSIDGHPSTVIGLPLPATMRLLARAGVGISSRREPTGPEPETGAAGPLLDLH
jgi:septum formation protein